MTESERTEAFEVLIKGCLEDLVEDGFISVEQINAQRWYIKWDRNEQLKNEGFAAATSIDNQNRPYMLFDPTASLKAIAWAIPHEVIHFSQICKGDWLPCYGYSIWKGERFDRLNASDPNYAVGQPWEAEVSSLESNLRARMYAKFPGLE